MNNYNTDFKDSILYSNSLALGIGAASFVSLWRTSARSGDGIWEWERFGVQVKFGEQRYSGKPDGIAGTPKANI